MVESSIGQVLKSPADHREYKALQLPNGLRAILIRDPHIITDAPKKPTDHGELIEDPEYMSGSDDQSDSSGSHDDDSSDDEMDSQDAADEDEDHQHVRHHHTRAPHTPGPIKKAAAALSVGIGYYSDPLPLQGLSHFLEHMLFMGSEKYPDENDYDAFLSSHSGASNACTEEECTTFHFDCAPHAFHDALDRFAQFFVSPLVKSNAMEREVMAVDNEFCGVLQNDACRMSQLRAHTSHSNHPASLFGWGNKKSLMEIPTSNGIDVRGELLKHYKGQYSAERMNLVVLGGESMDVLETWVKEKFSAVPSGCGQKPNYASYGAPYNGGEIYALPAVRDEHRISITYAFPCLEKEYKKKAEDYISHLIGHEGKGSLLAALKSRGWATELCAGIVDQTSASWIFEISITLTEEGLVAGQGCGFAVIELLFEYISMLQRKGPQQWAWEEMATIAGIKWRFLEEDDAAEYVAQVAGDMHCYPMMHVLAGQYVHEEYDAELISRLLALMNPFDARIDLQTRAFESSSHTLQAIINQYNNNTTTTNDTNNKIESDEEPWFKIPFIKATLPHELLHSWEKKEQPLSTDLDLPPKNQYLPTDFTLHSNSNNNTTTIKDTTTTDNNNNNTNTNTNTINNTTPVFPEAPHKILDDPGITLWHKLDSTFNVPRITSYARLSLSHAYTTPRHGAMTHLIVKLLEDSLCEEAYLADVAGLHYALWFEGYHGIDIKVEGFSHKIALLSEFIFKTFAALQFTDEDFRRVHESLVRAYTNAHIKPMRHATFSRLRVLKSSLWDVRLVLGELEKVTAADIRTFLPVLLSEVHIEQLIAGNVTKEQAVAMGNMAKCALGAKGQRAPPDGVAVLSPGSNLLYRASVVNPVEENSAIELYLQADEASHPKNRCFVDIIDQLTYEPCYDTLRTKEQLGYTVSSGARLTHGITGICIVIQSGQYGPQHLDDRADAFLTSFAERLEAMSDEEFEKQRQALIAMKMMKDRNLSEEVEKAWDALINRDGDFYARRDEVEVLKGLEKKEVERFMREVIAPGGERRRKLAVHIVGKGHVKEMDSDVVAEGVEVIKDVDEYKKTSLKFVAVFPHDR